MEEYTAANKERVEMLKQKLITKLRPWMEGDAQGFANSVVEEANELKKESYGAELLAHVIIILLFIFSSSSILLSQIMNLLILLFFL